MNSIVSLRLVTVIALSLLAACGGGETASSSDSARSTQSSGKPLTIKGSDTMVILTQRLAEEYMKAKPGEVVQVNGGGSGTGLAALVNGTVDLAQASRPMKDDEKAKIEKDRSAKVVETPIALDALAVFVNQANPIKELTLSQIADIFSGKTRNWSEVGGPNATIVLYGRESSSGTYDYFREHVLNKGDFVPTVQTLQGTAAIINAVGRDASGIGYGGIAYAKEVRALGISTTRGVPAVVPSEATVRDGSYPLSRKLFFYSVENAPDRVKRFVEWALTPEAQALVVNVGYFPLSTGAAPPTTPSTGTDPDPSASTSR